MSIIRQHVIDKLHPDTEQIIVTRSHHTIICPGWETNSQFTV